MADVGNAGVVVFAATAAADNGIPHRFICDFIFFLMDMIFVARLVVV